jgi:ankyrin repeat protein
MGRSLLSCAVHYGRLDLVKALLAAGANPNICDKTEKGATPLWQNVTGGRFRHHAAAIQDALLRAGASHSTPIGPQGETPFMMACETGMRDAGDRIRIFLAQGVDLEKVDNLGRTALHHAASSSAAVARILLKAGANPHAIDSLGNTALHLAAEGGRMDTFRALLAGGVDPTQKNHAGSTPVSMDQREADQGPTAIEQAMTQWRRTQLRKLAKPQTPRPRGTRKASKL